MELQFILLYVFTTVESALFMSLMMLTPFLVTDLGLSGNFVGYLQTTICLCQTVGTPLFGRICDLCSIKFSTALAFFSWAGVFFCMAMAQGPFFLWASRIFGTTALVLQAAQAAFAKLSTGAERSRLMDKLSICFGIGSIAGPVLIGVSANFIERRGLCAILALASVIAGVASFLFLPSAGPAAVQEKTPSKFDWATFRELTARPFVGLLMILRLLPFVPMNVQDSILVTYNIETLKAQQSDSAMLGTFLGVFVLVYCAAILPYLRKNLSATTITYVCGVSILWTYLWLLVYHHYWQLYYILPGSIIAIVTLKLIADDLLVALVDPSESGTVLGFANSTLSLAGILVPMLAPLMQPFFGFNTLPILGFFAAFGVIFLANRISDIPLPHGKTE